MVTMFDRLAGTPCAGCVHMCWDLYYDEPAGICTMKIRNRYGAWKSAAKRCAKLGFEYFEREEWKAEKCKKYEKEKTAAVPHCSGLPGLTPEVTFAWEYYK